MFSLVTAVLLSTILFSLPVWFTAFRRKAVSGFVFYFPFIPVITWMILVYLNIGAQSLSNFIEIIIINILTLLVLIAVLLKNRQSLFSLKIKFTLTLLFLIFVIGLRLLMPVIPE